jgi:hypothetical protein
MIFTFTRGDEVCMLEQLVTTKVLTLEMQPREVGKHIPVSAISS